jgi:cytochrome c oxidase cbb3-type subunit 3
MFDSGVFTSQFWEWFIIIPTVGGILGCFALILWLGGDRPDPDKKVETMGHVWDGDLAEYNNPLPRWWLNMFYITLYIAILYLLLYPGLGSFVGFLGWTEINQYQQEMDAAETRYGPIYDRYSKEPIAELAKNPEAVQLGHRLYMTYCTICHGSDAKGIKGFPNLRDDDWLWGGKPAQIEQTIKNGRDGNMPTASQNGLKSEAEIKNVMNYVRSLSGAKHDQAAAAEGEKTFKRVCFACHGMTGTGNQMLGAPNLTDKTWLYGGSPRIITETITNGRKGKMPAHGEFLGDAKVHLLATYIYSLSHNK